MNNPSILDVLAVLMEIKGDMGEAKARDESMLEHLRTINGTNLRHESRLGKLEGRWSKLIGGFMVVTFMLSVVAALLFLVR